MKDVKRFLTEQDEKEIVAAIQEAENNTSGELRVHIERSSKETNHFDRAKEVFHQLKMDNTKLQNGVLVYLAIDDRQLVILGDKGIDQVVPDGFWEKTKDLMTSHFKEKRFKKGLVEGIHHAGEQLKQHFPLEANDKNELENKISR